jgi:hypothetical protein
MEYFRKSSPEKVGPERVFSCEEVGFKKNNSFSGLALFGALKKVYPQIFSQHKIMNILTGRLTCFKDKIALLERTFCNFNT